MRLRANVLLYFLVATLLPVCAARADLKNDIRLGARWKQGERRQLELVHTFDRKRNGVVMGRGRITRRAELEVLAASQSGFVVRWSFADAKADQPLADLPVAEWPLLLTGIQVEVEADRAGDFNGIRNWQEVGPQAQQASERLMAANPAIKAADRTEHRRMVQAMFGQKRSMEAFFAKEIRLCTFMLGWYIAPGKPERYPDSLPNPFGGEPFPSRATLLLRAYDKGTGRADLRWWQNLDTEEAARILRASAEAEALRLGMPVPGPDDVPALHIGDVADIVLDNNTGWLRSLRNQRTTTIRKGAELMLEVRTLLVTDRTPAVRATRH